MPKQLQTPPLTENVEIHDWKFKSPEVIFRTLKTLEMYQIRVLTSAFRREMMHTQTINCELAKPAFSVLACQNRSKNLCSTRLKTFHRAPLHRSMIHSSTKMAHKHRYPTPSERKLPTKASHRRNFFLVFHMSISIFASRDLLSDV